MIIISLIFLELIHSYGSGTVQYVYVCNIIYSHECCNKLHISLFSIKAIEAHGGLVIFPKLCSCCYTWEVT